MNNRVYLMKICMAMPNEKEVCYYTGFQKAEYLAPIYDVF